jgi:anti-sigma factor RsiW
MSNKEIDQNDGDDEALSAMLREHATRHVASPALAASIRAEIALQTAGNNGKRAKPKRWQWHWHWPTTWSFAGGGFAGGAVAMLALMLLIGQVGPNLALESELESSHVRSLMPGHTMDVISTDQHTVKPWFQGKLDYSPPVQDFVAEGFPLVGGRLDYVGGRPVAALVYHRQQHVINLFVWPGNRPRPTTDSLHGYHVLGWDDGGMQYWAVSDVNVQDLDQFRDLWRRRENAPVSR